MKKIITVVVVVLALGLLTGLSVPLAQTKVYQVACNASTATALNTMQSTSAMRVWVNSATAVYLGGSDVNTSTKGMPFCTTSGTCIDDDLPIDGRDLYCLSSSGTVTVTVMAGK